MTYTEIHIWGDSLARGVIYNEEKSRYGLSAERCANRLEKALCCKVANHSVMGATVLDGLRAYDQFTPVPGALCAIEFGGNDCDLDWAAVAQHPTGEITGKVPLEAYAQGLETFVRRVRADDMIPLLVTPLPLHAPRYFKWVTRGLDAAKVLEALGDVEHIYRWQERYSITMRETAQRTDCALLDIRDFFLSLGNYMDYLCVDGIHPNNDGHRLIADAVLAAARRNGEMAFKPEAESPRPAEAPARCGRLSRMLWPPVKCVVQP